MAKAFVDKESYLGLLREHDVADFLHVDEDSDFQTECILLNRWNKKLNYEPENEGVDDLNVELVPIDQPDSVYVVYTYKNDEIMIVYILDKNQPNKSSLEIYYNQMTFLVRGANEMPSNEQEINSIIDHFVDENGQPYL